jgi:hypothetical protein
MAASYSPHLTPQLTISFNLFFSKRSSSNKGDVSAFLGFHVCKDTTMKTIRLPQPGLLEQVIQDVGFGQFSKGRDTAGDSILYADPDGLQQQKTWNYRNVVGKLNYIVNNTRPHISMAVHQCAIFSTNPIFA